MPIRLKFMSEEFNKELRKKHGRGRLSSAPVSDWMRSPGRPAGPPDLAFYPNEAGGARVESCMDGLGRQTVVIRCQEDSSVCPIQSVWRNYLLSCCRGNCY
ncbi:hypothetical protein J6590_000501 [Homalodisca vitripennis]|nr:hypothetical protein J6590_000501 [Homalodisca vitripennis]